MNSSANGLSFNHSLSDLYSKMCGENEVYSNKAFRLKLKERYGEHIYFSGKGIESDMVCLKSLSGVILRELKNCPQTENDLEVAARAGKIIKEHIRNMTTSNKEYPGENDICASEEGNP